MGRVLNWKAVLMRMRDRKVLGRAVGVAHPAATGERKSKVKEVVEFLGANPVQYLATVGVDGKAKCRPFMFLMEVDGRLWFGTNNQKAVYAEMQANPAVELCTSTLDFRWIRVSGNATFEDNRAVKEACMNIPMLREQYQTADNPIFEVFYLADGKAVISDMTGAEPAAVAL